MELGNGQIFTSVRTLLKKFSVIYQSVTGSTFTLFGFFFTTTVQYFVYQVIIVKRLPNQSKLNQQRYFVYPKLVIRLRRCCNSFKATTNLSIPFTAFQYIIYHMAISRLPWLATQVFCLPHSGISPPLSPNHRRWWDRTYFHIESVVCASRFLRIISQINTTCNKSQNFYFWIGFRFKLVTSRWQLSRFPLDCLPHSWLMPISVLRDEYQTSFFCSDYPRGWSLQRICERVRLILRSQRLEDYKISKPLQEQYWSQKAKVNAQVAKVV